MKPVLIKKRLEVQNSRTGMDGYNPFHACPACPYQSQIRSRTVRHISMCEKIRVMENLSNRKKQIDIISQNEPQVNLQKNIASTFLRPESFPQIESRITALEKTFIEMKDEIKSSKRQPNIYQLATDVYKMSSDAIKGVLIGKIAQAFSNSLQTDEEINRKKFQITSNLIGRFQEMDFSNLINSFREKLQKYFFNVQKDNEARQLTRPVQLEYQRAFKFFSSFQEVDMIIQIPVIQKLMSLGPYKKRFMIKFYTKMINDFPRMFPYDPIPKFLKKKSSNRSLHYEAISFQLVRQLTEGLMIDDPQLATDLWMVVCLGLRKSDTMRTFFYIPNTNTFAGYIKLVQKKNNHDCIRVVPSSLMRLITLTGAKYPITLQRYHKVKKFAINKFGRFYCLRGVCLTTIFAAFFKADALAQTHRNINVPMRHYVNFQSRSLIDGAFLLSNLPEVSFIVENELVLDFKRDGEMPIITNYKTKKLEFLGMNKADVVNQLCQIDQEQIEQTLNSSYVRKIIPTEEAFETFIDKVNNSVFLQYGITASNCIFSTIQKAISYFLPNSQVIKEELQTVVSNSPQKIEEICLIYSKNLRYQIHVLEIVQSQERFKYVDLKYGEGEYQIRIIKILHHELGTYFIPCQNHSEDQNKGVITVRQRRQECASQLVLSLQNITCPQCTKTKLTSIPCIKGNHIATYCQNCQCAIHSCQSQDIQSPKFFEKDQITIHPMKIDEISHYLRPLKSQTVRNNIRQTVTNQGYQYTTNTIYINGIPTVFSCQYRPLDLATSKIILQNREQEEFLPLLIKESTIKNAGLGVFSTAFIPKNTILCSYIGEIGVGSNISYLKNGVKNDSLYFLGNIGSDSLNIAPCVFSNVGRFINHNRRRMCNCSPHIGLLQENKNKFEVCVFITSNRQIKSGEEIFYFYGKEYQFDIEREKKGS